MSISIELLNFSFEDFIIIAAIMGEKSIMGMDNPFKDSSDDEIIRSWLNLKEKLKKNNYIMIDAKGGMKIDKSILFTIKECCNCMMYISLSGVRDGKKEEYHLYITSKGVFKICNIEKNQISVKLYNNVDFVGKMITNILSKDIDTNIKYETITLNDNELIEFRKYINDRDKNYEIQKEFLDGIGNDEKCLNL
jgi:hypothetical protein